MPGLDGTGPNGMGSMTGGARGVCSGNVPGSYRSSGCGFGYGRGIGYGRRAFAGNRNFQKPLPVSSGSSEIEELRAMAESLKNSVEMLNSRLDKMAGEE
jgi:hypothetical protein